MSSRIIILDKATASKIAAGEVVERPASIIKELIENSIDAGSSNIEIEINGGGRDCIRLTDDGCGMNEEEANLAIERHSTSKIKNATDLFSIKTLGFRGEALPSIASVSKMELVTKELLSQTESGTKLVVEGGKIISAQSTGCPYGTTIIVKDLFYNTPARLKFLKSTKVEMAHITDIVSKFIISSPLISFKLSSNGKEILSSAGKSELIDALCAAYGIQLTKSLLSIKYSDETTNIYGYISSSNIDRIDRSMESFFVNGRYVKNIQLSKALEEGYRNIIPSDRYPIAVIFIETDPTQIDVNVHPSKREIKFSNTGLITKAITEVVKDSLSGTISTAAQNNSFQMQSDAIKDFVQGDLLPQILSENIPAVPFIQIDNTYIAASEDADLIIIDQHGAHERILFEKLMREKDFKMSQKLLVPETLEITPHEAVILEVNLKFLNSIGFEIELFGKNTFTIRVIPDILINSDIKRVLQDIINEFINLERSVQFEIIEERIKKLIACHGAIKAGDKLDSAEVFKLMSDLKNTTNNKTCPHGRPTIKKIDKKELEKMFGRR